MSVTMLARYGIPRAGMFERYTVEGGKAEPLTGNRRFRRATDGTTQNAIMLESPAWTRREFWAVMSTESHRNGETLST